MSGRHASIGSDDYQYYCDPSSSESFYNNGMLDDTSEFQSRLIRKKSTPDFENLTFQGNLRDFWTKATPPDPKVFHAFRQYHMNVTQINGHFYSKVNLPH